MPEMISHGNMPSVSVVIATRNRGAQILPTLRSILDGAVRDIEVLVIDQSDNDLTAQALRNLEGSARVRYVRDTCKGLSRARNLGLSLVHAPLVAITDDDCIPPRNWLALLLGYFEGDVPADIVFSAVEAPTLNYRKAIVPVFHPTHERVEHGLSGCAGRLEGIGANLAFRRDVVRRLGGFNPWFGAGGPRWSGEDRELHYRALRDGACVYVVREPAVLHVGIRASAEKWALWKRDALGAGAISAYIIRQGSPLTALRFWWWHIGRIVQAALLRTLFLRFPVGIKLAGWMVWHSLRGCAIEWRHPGPLYPPSDT